jgi:hypothetical protein
MRSLSFILTFLFLATVIAGGVVLIPAQEAFARQNIDLSDFSEDAGRAYCNSLVRSSWPPSPGGTTLQGNFTTEGESDSTCSVPAMNDLIQYLYEWIIGIAGLIVFLMLIIGGFRYMFSAGDAQKTAEGRKNITNAVLGLVLILVSTLVLNLINPDLGGVARVTFDDLGGIELSATVIPPNGAVCHSIEVSYGTIQPTTGSEEGTESQSPTVSVNRGQSAVVAPSGSFIAIERVNVYYPTEYDYATRKWTWSEGEDTIPAGDRNESYEVVYYENKEEDSDPDNAVSRNLSATNLAPQCTANIYGDAGYQFWTNCGGQLETVPVSQNIRLTNFAGRDPVRCIELTGPSLDDISR